MSFAKPRPAVRAAAMTVLAAMLVAACACAQAGHAGRNAADAPDSHHAAATPAEAATGHDALMHAAPNPDASIAYTWIDIIEEAAARRVERIGAKPTIISRDMAIAVTAMYDAWAAYDGVAVGTRLGGSLRRPPGERTAANRAEAISRAVYRCLLFCYPEQRDWLGAKLRAMGFDPDAPARDRTSPAGVGDAVADALIAYRAHDGANQLGDEPGSDGTPYSDYTGYAPVNTPDHVVDPDHWQPIAFADGKGGHVTPGFLTPHWYRVKPFALTSGDQFRPATGPPKVGTPELKADVDQVLAYNRELTPWQKAVVEFMRDGPRSTGQSGHWLHFAQDVARRDHLDVGHEIRLFFCVANVCFDGFIACWDAKRVFDSSRPWTLIHHYYQGQTIAGWAGPCRGVISMPGERWHPYSPDTFITPPFPGFPSGHATVSGASARILELCTGSDRFGAVERRRAGILTEGSCDLTIMQARDGVPALGLPATEVELLVLPTFSATAEMAALSRALGGYHIPYDNNKGLEIGRAIADYSWPKYQAYFTGTAAAP